MVPGAVSSMRLLRAQPLHSGFTTSFLFFWFFPFLVTWWHVEFLGQELNPSHSCDLSHSCSNAGSLTYWAGPEIEPK